MVCVMSNKHIKMALLFLCQPSLQPPLSSCHFTSLLSLWCCDECGCPIHATNESKWSEDVSAIITSLWCLVFVVWCPQTPLIFLIHSLHLPTVTSCVVIAWLHGVVLFGWVWNECTDSHAQWKRTAHRHVCAVWCMCDGVVWKVVWACREKSGGMMEWEGKWRSERHRHTKAKDALFPQTTFPHYCPSVLFSNPFLSWLSPAVLLPILYDTNNFYLMHNTCVYPQLNTTQSNTTLNSFRLGCLMSIISLVIYFIARSSSNNKHLEITISNSSNKIHYSQSG